MAILKFLCGIKSYKKNKAAFSNEMPPYFFNCSSADWWRRLSVFDISA